MSRLSSCVGEYGHRKASVDLSLVDKTGQPLSNREITVRMLRHAFLFGCNAFVLDPENQEDWQAAYQERFAGIFNFATLGFYWPYYEPTPARTRAEPLARQARWLNVRGIRTKGHPLVWRQTVPDWLPPDPEETGRLQVNRVTRDVSAFAGTIDTWDVINEVADWTQAAIRYPNPLTDLYMQIGGLEIVQRSFRAARAAHPAATLLINDYQTGDEYAALIEQCLDAGVSIDAIGIQSHMHMGPWTAETTHAVLERFSRFNLPLHFTETTLISGARKQEINWSGRYGDWHTSPEGEEQQAERVGSFYRLLFSHPRVEAVTWWDFSDRNAWMGAPSGLVRKDMTPKPAYMELERLIRHEWWTPDQTLTTDQNGQAHFEGFFGDYEMECAGKKNVISVHNATCKDVRLTAKD